MSAVASLCFRLFLILGLVYVIVCLIVSLASGGTFYGSVFAWFWLFAIFASPLLLVGLVSQILQQRRRRDTAWPFVVMLVVVVFISGGVWIDRFVP